MVAKPVGIRTVLSSVPSWTGHDGGDPRRYFKLGRFTMGNGDGFQFSHGIEYGQQLLYPMPPVWELLAYDIKNGASCLFQELVDVPDLTLKQPWDRTPTVVEQVLNTSAYGPVNNTTGWTYTVPTLRRLWVAKAGVAVRRWVVATSVDRSECWITAGGTTIVYANLVGGAQGANDHDDIGSGPLILPAATVLTCVYNNLDGNGRTFVSGFLSGFLFDA